MAQMPSWIHFISPVPDADSDTEQAGTACSLHEGMNERQEAVIQPCLSPVPPLYCAYCILYLESLSLAIPVLFAFIIALSVHGPGQVLPGRFAWMLEFILHLCFLSPLCRCCSYGTSALCPILQLLSTSLSTSTACESRQTEELYY